MGFYTIAKHGDKTSPFFTSLSQGSLREQEHCSWGNAWFCPTSQDTKHQVQGTNGHLGPRIREPGFWIRTSQDPRNRENWAWLNARNLDNWERWKLQEEETNKYWWGKGNLSCAKFFLVHLDHTVDLLVYFDHTVDLPNKPKAGEEADCTWKKINWLWVSCQLFWQHRWYNQEHMCSAALLNK